MAIEVLPACLQCGSVATRPGITFCRRCGLPYGSPQRRQNVIPGRVATDPHWRHAGSTSIAIRIRRTWAFDAAPARGRRTDGRIAGAFANHGRSRCAGAMTRGSGDRWYPQPAGGLGDAARQCVPDRRRRPAEVARRVGHQVSRSLPGGFVAGAPRSRPLAARHFREECDLAELPGHEVPVHDLTVARHDLALAGRIEQVEPVSYTHL